MEGNNLGIDNLNAFGSYRVGEYWFYSSELEYISVSRVQQFNAFHCCECSKSKMFHKLGGCSYKTLFVQCTICVLMAQINIKYQDMVKWLDNFSVFLDIPLLNREFLKVSRENRNEKLRNWSSLTKQKISGCKLKDTLLLFKEIIWNTLSEYLGLCIWEQGLYIAQ